MSDLRDDIYSAWEIADTLESKHVNVMSVSLKTNPRSIEIQVLSRRDVETCCAIFNLVLGAMFGQIDCPLIGAIGEYGGVYVYVYGRAS